MASSTLCRREILACLGALTAAYPLGAQAQASKPPVRIGILPLGSSSNDYDRSLVEAFRKGLLQSGLVEQRDFVLDVAWTTAQPEQALAELMQRGAQILVPCGTSASLAAKRGATDVPIVFVSVGNPLGIGLVESLSRPGGNLTGFSDILADLGGKLVEVARELNRSQPVFDYLWHTGWGDAQHRLRVTETAAREMGVSLRLWGVAESAEIGEAMAAVQASGANTLIVQPSPFTYGQRDLIIKSALAYRLAAIFAFPAAAREGALIAYGPDYVHMYRRAPFYVERILKGTKPGDLPVEQPSKVELVVNLQTSKALGLEVPLPLLIRADELVE
ncbi:MAG TPA: ABC transporter substrate-binding protein [Beijerinckiaceae bacterium]